MNIVCCEYLSFIDFPFEACRFLDFLFPVPQNHWKELQPYMLIEGALVF